MLKEQRHLKNQRRMRIKMALNELNVCYHGEPEDARTGLGDLWGGLGDLWGSLWIGVDKLPQRSFL